MNRPFAPKFLVKYDDYLLKNKPELYSTRFHWVLYYALVAITCIALLFAIIPNDARSDTPIFIHTCLVVIVAMIGLVVWLIFLLRFNVFKRFGNVTAFGRLSVFWLYFLSSVIIIFSCFVPSIVETLKANIAFKEKELINDLNTINTSICKLEYDSLKQNWEVSYYQAENYFSANKDTILTESTFDDYEGVETVTYSANSHEDYEEINEKRINLIDYYILLKRLKSEDSVVKVNDSTYIFYTCPDYKKVSSGYNGRIIEESSLSNIDLYRNIFSQPIKINRAKEWQTLKPLLEKYNYEYGSLRKYQPAVYFDYDSIYEQRLQKRYNISTIENNIRNIIERKYRYDDFDENQIYIRLIFYPSIIFSLLLFAFRHSTIKTFFLSILTSIIFLISAAIISAFSQYGDTEVTIFTIMLCYLILFLLIAATTFNAQRRTAFQGIAINLFTCMVYFLPLIIVGWYYSYVIEPTDKLALELFEERKVITIVIAELICPVLLSVLLVSFIYKLYRRWYALPQQ